MTAVTNNLPAGLTLENTTMQTLLTKLLDKARIGLMLPVQKTKKEESEDSGFFLHHFPNGKRALLAIL